MVMFHLAPLYEKGGLIMSNSSSSGTLSPNTWLERQFHLTARHSSIKTEFLSGLSIYVSMVYIIPVSTGMFAAAGVDLTLAAISIALVTAVFSILRVCVRL